MGQPAKSVMNATAADCCALCAANSGLCVAWHVTPEERIGTLRCVLKSTLTRTRVGNCTYGAFVPPHPSPVPPGPSPVPPGPSPVPPSATLAFHKMFMGGAVLQRDEYTPVWGTAAPGQSVKVSLGGNVVRAVTNSSGIWLVHLPPQPAQYNVSLSVSLQTASHPVVSAATESVQTVVSFGEVILCAGQSNMGMQVGPSERGFDADNATAEAAAAYRYSGRIQLFESGGGRSTNPAWFTVDPVSIRNFSAVCWYTGRDLFDSLFASVGQPVPVGLILSAIGAHPIESWLGPKELASCGVPQDVPCESTMPQSKIWGNAIVPVAPFKLGFFIWDQAEADVSCRSLNDTQDRLVKYPCMEKALLSSFRTMFNSTLGFAAVQLPGYSPVQRENVFEMRLQQDGALRGSVMGGNDTGSLATAVPTYDLSCAMGKTNGCPHGNVHNVHKQPVGARLAAQILHMHLGKPGTVSGPRVAGFNVAAAGGGFDVTVNFAGGSAPFALRPTRNCTTCCGDDAGTDVGDFDASSDGISWTNGTKPVLVNGTAVHVHFPSMSALQIVRYTANRAFPQCALYNREGYPAFPFRERIDGRLGAPQAATTRYDVTDFGATGDGITDDSKSIARALAAAASAPSSVVVFPPGKVFLTAPINMSSGMTLQVDGTLRAKSGNNSLTGISGWPQMPPLPSYGNSRDGPYLQFQAFLYASEVEDIAINGSGTIDGSGDWWWHNQRNRSLIPAGRPNLIQFVNAKRVEVTGVTLRDSPFWCLHPVQCEDVHVHHMKIRSRMYAPNSDGIDPDSCKNVMIEHNDISTGDDGIAIKAGVCGASSPNDCVQDKNFSDGTYLTRNVTVRHNIFRIGMGISVGSESSGGIQDVYIHDNVVGLCEAGHCLDKCCGWGPALHLKTALTRGGTIQNIVFKDNTIINNTGFIDMETNYQSGDTPPSGYAPTTVRDIVFSGNRVLGSGTGASFVCSVHDACDNITVTNNTVAQNANPWHCKFVRSFTTSNNTGESDLQNCMNNSMTPP